ncbi:MAG: hypothetical protein JKY80_01765, partial [Mariprofundaceae bacterium]|nr:hypothetical protein [Mariprofundaceae bacterium]
MLNDLKLIALTSDDVCFALQVAEQYGYLLSKNPVGIYREDEFESSLISRFDEKVEKIKTFHENDRILHVISAAYKGGGHTRLLERLARSMPKQTG